LEEPTVEQEAIEMLENNLSNLKIDSQRLMAVCEEQKRENSVLHTDKQRLEMK